MEKFVQMITKRAFFYFLTVVVSFAVILVASSSTKALAAPVRCQISEDLYGSVQDTLPDMDMRRTAVTHLAASAFEGIPFVGMGKNNSVIQKCAVHFMNERDAGLTGESCNIAPEECDDFLIAYGQGDSLAGKSTTPGTLLGLSNSARASVMSEPIPVNLAYWWNDGVSKVPFVGKALAAEPATYKGPFVTLILGAWQFMRNVAYGLMSIVMLVIGFMIITRKKIGTQAAVTVQLALPKIIIALILITFSYPIGAFGATAAWAMRGNTSALVNTIQGLGPNLDDEGQDAQKLSIAIVGAIVFLLGGGSISVILALISGLVAIVFVLMLFIKILIIYLKILFSIIIAPLIFTFGAIPGNEEQTIKWFKRFAANVISIPAMWFVCSLSWKLTWTAILNLLDDSQSFVFGGGVLMLLIVPFFLLFGLNFARQVPDKIEAAIVGDPKKR